MVQPGTNFSFEGDKITIMSAMIQQDLRAQPQVKTNHGPSHQNNVSRGLGRCSNLVENMLTQFLEGPTPGKSEQKDKENRETVVDRAVVG